MKPGILRAPRRISRIRKIYIQKLIGRIAIFFGCLYISLVKPKTLTILKGWNFFKQWNILHILWAIWILDMIWQLVPSKNAIALGSQKLFKFRYVSPKKFITPSKIKEHILSITKSAYIVFAIWAVAILIISGLHYYGFLDDIILFMMSVTFYVCDLICVLFWCPFRLIMKNQCCTTCRIFNWDHLMMFTPMISICGFFSITLLLMAFIVFLAWELSTYIHPERFWAQSNPALSCSNCTDKLCTQYCQKLRKPHIIS